MKSYSWSLAARRPGLPMLGGRMLGGRMLGGRMLALLVLGWLGAPVAMAIESAVETDGVADTELAAATPLPAGDAATDSAVPAPSAANTQEAIAQIEARPEEPPPYDYAPYRVLIWIASDDPQIDADSIRDDLLDFLDRDFFSVWRTVVADAPTAVATIAQRDIGSIDFELIAASDPVIALKRGHKDSLRIHFASDAGRFLKDIPTTAGRLQDILDRIAQNPESKTIPAKFAWKDTLRAIDGDAVALAEMWQDESTAAILVSRGMADTLTDPEAKVIALPLEGQVVDVIEEFDKIYVVRVNTQANPGKVDVVELDTLMRHFGAVTQGPLISRSEVAKSVGMTVREAFSPSVRIDDAGSSSAVGLVRASALALDENSPIHVRVGDVLEPMVRKDDRNGKPISVGPLDWAYLIAVEHELAGFGAPAAAGVQPGDRVVSVAGHALDDPHNITHLLGEIPTKTFEIEIQREGETKKLTLAAGDTLALQPQYLGVRVRERTIAGERRTVITEVLPESPAVGKLSKDDIILAVGESTDIDAQTLLSTVLTTSESPSVDVTVQRGEATETISMTPSPISNRNQRAPSSINMDFFTGRIGGLQGRKNSRTHRMALRIRPRLPNTMLRLHAKGRPNEPLIGYEIYDRELNSSAMTFVGRTDWNGRMVVEKIDRPLRLLYVKNGGAVLARLPIVPGHHALAVADLAGDDMRLQAEAYIRGVQNAIVDLVAIRELFKARIMMRIQEGKLKEADELLEMLRNEPSNEKIANDMGVKQTMFLKAIGRNAQQQTKVDEMFRTTRELLSKQISPKIINDLERALIDAQQRGGSPTPQDTPAEASSDGAAAAGSASAAAAAPAPAGPAAEDSAAASPAA